MSLLNKLANLKKQRNSLLADASRPAKDPRSAHIDNETAESMAKEIADLERVVSVCKANESVISQIIEDLENLSPNRDLSLAKTHLEDAHARIVRHLQGPPSSS